MIEPCLYRGTVTHRRLRPLLHSLSYKVAAVLVDVDQVKSPHWFLSNNQFNLFAIYDKDHGTGQTIAEFAWSFVKTKSVRKIYMLCYPRLLGYVFNPMTTYFCVDEQDRIRQMIYEVHNTFGGRHTYVTDVFDGAEPNYFQTDKTFYVSPFNKIEGHYNLKASQPGARVSIGVALTTPEGPTMNAYFSGQKVPLTDANLLRVFFGYPLMTLKVFAAIHYEALKLWLKGLKVQS